MDEDFAAGSTFPCPVCDAPSKVYDTSEQTGRHLNFFEHLTFLAARQPRVRCIKHGVKTVTVPWAKTGSDFTLFFEAMIVLFGRNGMTPTAIARIVGEHDTRIWRVLEHYVDKARERATFAGVEKVGVDETSRAKGHAYVTIFADIEKARVMFVTEGKDYETLGNFKLDFVAHGGDPSKISDFSLDMSKAFIKGIGKEFANAHLTFDKFHVIKLMNETVDNPLGVPAFSRRTEISGLELPPHRALVREFPPQLHPAAHRRPGHHQSLLQGRGARWFC